MSTEPSQELGRRTGNDRRVYEPVLGAFLRSRRERLTPSDAGIAGVGRRRTVGLRREEVAILAGISPTWYMHLEQGRATRPSREVIDALARALRLDPGERAYLLQIAYGARHQGDRRSPERSVGYPAAAAVARSAEPLDSPLPASIDRLLDVLVSTPALIINRCWDVVAWNTAATAVLPSLGSSARHGAATRVTTRNLVELVLTDPTWRSALRDWADVARLAVGGLRASLVHIVPSHPQSTRAAALIQRLQEVSPEFRVWWPAHSLWLADRPITHVYEHPQVGSIEVDGTMLDVRSAPGLTLLTYVPCNEESAERIEQLQAAIRNV